MNDNNKLTEENKEIIDKDNSEIISEMYSNNNFFKKNNPINEYTRTSKFKDDGESEKYIKEMHEVADKNEFKNNVIVLALGILTVSVIIFSVLMNTSFMKAKADVVEKEVNEVIPKTTVDSLPTKQVEQKNNIFKYLDVETNRDSTLKKAVDLNDGSKTGLTVYVLSEILRSNTYDIPTDTSTVKELMLNLTSMGWKKNTDFNELEKGDICFTTDTSENPGVPTHTYVFMGWSEDGKTDYANIVDGQIQEYNNVLHKRNISVSIPDKDKFSFFLKK